MKKKPDRFERMVSKYESRGMPDYDNHVLADHEVIKLLRAEHAWMRRQVRAYLRGSTDTGYVVACNEILSALDQRRK